MCDFVINIERSIELLTQQFGNLLVRKFNNFNVMH